MLDMKRREFITLLGGVAVSWSLTAGAQQRERARHIGVLFSIAEGDSEVERRLTALQQGLSRLGWTIGRDINMDYRFGRGDAARTRSEATELVAAGPDLIVASGALPVSALHQATRTIPIVFVQVVDPVGGGFVQSLARPGGNITGFTVYDYEIGGKWLSTLKEAAPSISRLAVLRDPSVASGVGPLGAVQAMAASIGIQSSPIDVRDMADMERDVAAFARVQNGGLIVLAAASATIHRDFIISLAARHRLPAIYPYRYFAASGGLMSYGVDPIDIWRRAASYVDRILRGERPAELPVQAPVKYELVINRKTAKALGLDVPPTLLARADEVIE
jgi:putative tryptophan/tyrosine transport system substrate-binding protein